MVKNDIIRLKIIDVTLDGQGVGKTDEKFTVFVPFTAVGEVIDARIVKVHKSYAYGILQNIIMPSPDRVSVDCTSFGKCGGCVFRHISYEAERKIKANNVADAFSRMNKLEEINPNYEILPLIADKNTDYYRNKVCFPVSSDGQHIFFGLFAPRSHRVVPFSKCKLQEGIFAEIASLIVNFANDNRICAYNEITGVGIIRHIFIRNLGNEIDVCIVNNEKNNIELYISLTEKLVSTFPTIKNISININNSKTNVIFGNEFVNLYGNKSIHGELCGNEFLVHTRSFFQVNTASAEKLYRIAADLAEFRGDETLLDLYCGVGTITLFMSNFVKKAIGVEIVREAIENARINAKTNEIPNVEFYCADAGRVPYFVNSVDIIITDPPRAGCSTDTLKFIIEQNPKKVIMISCNPATVARDVRYLCEHGFTAVKTVPVDLFPRTGHVESVTLLLNKNSPKGQV